MDFGRSLGANSRRQPGALGLLLVVLALPLVGHAALDAGEQAYREVRQDVSVFRQDAQKRRYRHHYLNLVRRLRQVAEHNPEGRRADDALYVAAQLLQEMHQTSHHPDDLAAAIAAFEHMAKTHPRSNLADDALFEAASLRWETTKDAEGARTNLNTLLALAGTPDFRGKAKAMLSRLPASEQAAVKTNTVAPQSSSAQSVDTVPTEDVNAILARVTAQLEKGAAPAPPQVEVLPEAPPTGTPVRTTSGISHQVVGGESVLTLDASGLVGVVRGEIPATADAGRRLYFDLMPLKLAGSAKDSLVVGDGVLRTVRLAQHDENVVRLVVELEGEEEPSLKVRRSPFQLSLRAPIRNVNPNLLAATSPMPSADHVRERLGDSGAPGGVSISQQFGLKVRRIVLDAGHGGHDTGAVGPSGVREKDVTLAIAKMVRQKLLTALPDIEVVMTRDEDNFVELSERTKLANDSGADLFISIHANANPSRKVRGVETYYLNITHDRYSIRLAARENAAHSDESSISDLQYILADLAMKSNVDDSIRLGRQVQSSVVGSLRTQYSDVQDLGLKHALFAVLIGARMPAILIETSFVSNRVEEKRLRSSKYQEALAQGIVQGVRKFMEERQAFYVAQP